MGFLLHWRWRAIQKIEEMFHLVYQLKILVSVFENDWFILALFLIRASPTKRMNPRTAERKVAFSGFNAILVERFITHCSRLSPPFSAASYCSSAHVEPMSNRIICGWLVCAPVSAVRPTRLKMATQKYANCSGFLKKKIKEGSRGGGRGGGLASWCFSKTLVALAQTFWDDMDFHPSVRRQTGCESAAHREF